MARQKKDDPKQLNLLDLISMEDTVVGRQIDQPGALNMSAAVRQALYDSIKESGLDRFDICAQMSRLLDVEVSKTTLDSWTAESKEGHRFPLEFASVFCVVTGSNRVIEVICQPIGVFALTGPDAIRSELNKVTEQKQLLSSQEKDLKSMLSLFAKAKK